PRSVDVDVDQDDSGVPQERARLLARDGASAEREHRRLRRGQQAADHGRLGAAEGGLALGREELRDAEVNRLLDAAVDVDEGPPEARRDLSAERGLPRAHEPDEGQMSVERRGGQVTSCYLEGWAQRMRSRYARCAPTKSPT